MTKTIFFTSICKKYSYIQSKIKRDRKIMDFGKLIITICIFLSVIGTYGYFVNISSTKGYFLRQQMQNVEQSKFEHSITQLEVLKLEKNIWDEIQGKAVINSRKNPIDNNIVYINIDKNASSIAYLK